MRARRNRPLVLIDIAVPRDIAADVQQVSNVYLYDVDDLEVIVRENMRLREREFTRCREIIDEKTRAVLDRVVPQPEMRRPMRDAEFALWQPAVCAG
jgi:glutamyl-tRNA reductase